MNPWGFGELLIQTVRNSQRRWNFIRCIIRRVGEILTFGFRLSHVNAWVGPVPVQAVPGDPSMSELGQLPSSRTLSRTSAKGPEGDIQTEIITWPALTSHEQGRPSLQQQEDACHHGKDK